jgi:DNA-directed RNA polymerase specialized sigma24 family protein
MDGPRAAFEQLLSRARAGDRAAMGELFLLYSDPVLRVVRRKLPGALRRRYDSGDFVQSVWTSFVQLPLEDYSFATPEDLVAFLSRIAYNKVAETARQGLGGTARDLRRETSLDAPKEEPVGRHLSARLPTPSQHAIAEECWQRITRGLPAGHVGVLELLRDGHAPLEISRRLGVHAKVIQRLRERLQHYLSEE